MAVQLQLVSKKKLPVPKWWKNTYFWIAGILFVVGVIGLIYGQNVIRDPGQKDEGGLVWIYFVGSVLMLVNGILSHKHTVFLYSEQLEMAEYEDKKLQEKGAEA